MRLFAQVRRAVYHGPYTKLLNKLVDNCTDFQAIRCLKQQDYQACPKDSDQEMILRAFAFRRSGDKYKRPLKTFLNKEIDGTEENIENRNEKDQKKIEEMLAENEREFETVMKIARRVFENWAFRKRDSGTISTPMWDAKYCAIVELLAQYKEIDFTEAKDSIQRLYQDSLKDGFFSKDDNVTTAKKFTDRKEELKTLMRKAMEERATFRDEKRTFAPALRQPLFDRQQGQCAICRQSMDHRRLNDGTYLHVDHRVPHSKGGATDMDNAQLVHSECNLKKSARL